MFSFCQILWENILYYYCDTTAVHVKVTHFYMLPFLRTVIQLLVTPLIYFLNVHLFLVSLVVFC